MTTETQFVVQLEFDSASNSFLERFHDAVEKLGSLRERFPDCPEVDEACAALAELQNLLEVRLEPLHRGGDVGTGELDLRPAAGADDAVTRS